MKQFDVLKELIKKHFKVVGRSKSSLVTIIMGPLLIMLIIGIAFSNSSLQSINVALFINQGYENNTQELLTSIDAGATVNKIFFLLNESFYINERLSLDSCINSVKKEGFHVCIELPYNLDPENTAVDNYVNIYADVSQINLAYSLLADISEKVSFETKRLSVVFTKQLLDTISSSNNLLTGDKTKTADAKTALSNLERESNDVRNLLQSMNLNVDTTDELNNLNQIANTAEQVELQLTGYNDLTTEIINDYNSISNALSSAESDYDECLASNNSDCTDLESEIEVLEDTQFTIQSYVDLLGYDSNNTNTTDVSAIKNLALATISTLETINNDLSSAKTTKSSSLSLISSISQKSSSASSSVNQVDSDIARILSDYSAIKVKEVEKIVNPLNINIESISKEGTFLEYSFPLLIILVICFLGILLSSRIIMIEKKSTAFFRNYITPAKDYLFLVSNFIVMLIIILFEILLVSAVGILVFGIEIKLLHILSFIPAIILISTVFILIGMSIGFLFQDEESSTMASIFISSFLFLFSPIIIPLESMPVLVGAIAKLSPLVISNELLKRIILFGLPIHELLWQVLAVVIYILVFIFIIFLTHEVHRKRI